MSLLPPIDEQAARALKQNIENLLDARAKHSLEYLRERASLALENDRLIHIASRNTANASKDIALKHNFDEERARSCRFLAMIRRDHGQEEFERTVREHKESKPLKMLRDELVPRIQLLEALAGAPLLITSLSRESQMSLTDYLLAGPPSRLDLKLALGDFKIYMKATIEKVHDHLMPSFSYRLVKNGVGLAKKSFLTASENPGRYEFLEMMIRQILTWVGERDYIKGYEDMPLIAAVIEDIESRGEKFPPRLSSWSAVNTLTETGSVEGLKLAIREIRKACEEEGFNPNYMRYFNFEAARAIEQAEKLSRKFDPNIELIDKVNSGVINSFISAYRVPGEDSGLDTNFLLVNQTFGDVDTWLEALREAGFGGCHVFGTFNLPSAMDIVQTGQIDILLMDKTLVGTEPRNWLTDIAGSSTNPLVALVHYEDEHCLATCLKVLAEEEF